MAKTKYIRQYLGSVCTYEEHGVLRVGNEGVLRNAAWLLWLYCALPRTGCCCGSAKLGCCFNTVYTNISLYMALHPDCCRRSPAQTFSCNAEGGRVVSGKAVVDGEKLFYRLPSVLPVKVPIVSTLTKNGKTTKSNLSLIIHGRPEAGSLLSHASKPRADPRVEAC